MIKPTLNKTLPLLINTYKNIDVRTAAIKNHDKVWCNVVTTIRFTSKDKREIKLPVNISNEKFKIECFSVPVNGKDDVISHISKDSLAHNKSEIYFDVEQNIYSIELFEEPYWMTPAEKNRVEKIFEGIATHDVKWSETITLLLKEMSNMASVTSLGYKDMYDAIKGALGLTSYSSGNTSLAIVVDLPIYAKVRTSVKARTFNFDVTFHEMLPNMLLFIVSPEDRQPQSIPIVPDQCEKMMSPFRKFSYTVSLPDHPISSRLVFKDAPEVEIWHAGSITREEEIPLKSFTELEYAKEMGKGDVKQVEGFGEDFSELGKDGFFSKKKVQNKKE